MTVATIVDRIPVRLRLSLGHAIWMALLFSGIGLGLYRVVEHNLYQSVDAALLASARSIHDARFVRGFNSPLMEDFLAKFFTERCIRPYAQLIDLSGKVSAKTSSMRVTLRVTPTAVANAERGFETFETFLRASTNTQFHQITLPVFYHGRFTGELIQVGAPLDSTIHTLRSTALALWFALPAGLLFSILFGYSLTKRALRPVHDMQLAASKLGARDLGVRLELPAAKDELRELAMTFNGMLDRLEDAFKRLRRFSGDVSHELRTPVAVLRAEAELALRRDRCSEEYKNALRTIVHESATMSTIIEDLLLLARAESRAVAMSWAQIDKAAFIANLKESVIPVFEKRCIELCIVDKFSPACFQGSSGFLAISLKNILLNAAKHSSPQSAVNFSIEGTAERITFTITDEGEGIPEESLPYIFDPFYRADTARNRNAGGVGVGLSLTQALVKLHDGTIEAQSKPGQGATFIISLPQPALGETELRAPTKPAQKPSSPSLLPAPALNH